MRRLKKTKHGVWSRMAKQRYIALFDNGKARKRATLNRTYTHAWLVEYISVCRGTPKEGCDHGFAASEALAAKALHAFVRRVQKHGGAVTYQGIAPALDWRIWTARKTSKW